MMHLIEMSYYPCYQVNYGNCGPQLQYIPQGYPCPPTPPVPPCPPFPPYCPTGPTGTEGPTGSNGLIGPTGDKTFIIDHPVDPNRYLVHACLEGPEVGIYYRGTGEIKQEDGIYSTIIHLPEYVQKMGTEFTVQITPIYSGKPRRLIHEVSEVTNGTFIVFGEPGRFFWHVYGKRSNLIVEPLKIDVEVKGLGPYRWM